MSDVKDVAIMLSKIISIEAIGCKIVDCENKDFDLLNMKDESEILATVKFSIPEFSELTKDDLTGIFSEVTDAVVAELNSQEGKIKFFKKSLIESWAIEDDFITAEEYSQYVKFLCKVRTGETWKGENLAHTVGEYYKQLEEAKQKMEAEKEFKEV